MSKQKDPILDICMCIDSKRTNKEKAEWILANYFGPMDDALTASKDRERVLVEALEAVSNRLLSHQDSTGCSTFDCDDYRQPVNYVGADTTAINKARAALASVKNVQDAE